MRVLGIDPSSQATGFGIIENSGQRYGPVCYGIITPSRQLPFHQKMNEIKVELDKIIETYAPDEVAIENPFYAQNIRTALALGQVRGAILVAIASHGCSLHEYSALEIKKAVTGYGQADKEQVKTMVKALLEIDDPQLPTDASDALAAAICHLNTSNFQKQLEGD
jgi:crossover junction endodeoxyribonuclease RuvC